MKKRAAFRIPSLLAAGLVPLSAQADDKGAVAPNTQTWMDNFDAIVSDISSSHSYTLAQHRSHQSHSSHGSHRSHRSYSYRPAPIEDPGLDALLAATSSRNELSTPLTTILPNSPATAKKLKVLPGNSKAFRKVVIHLQVALARQGYNVGAINGEVHARTIAAIYQYQGKSGMIPSGKVTNEVLSSLGIMAR